MIEKIIENKEYLTALVADGFDFIMLYCYSKCLYIEVKLEEEGKNTAWVIFRTTANRVENFVNNIGNVENLSIGSEIYYYICDENWNVKTIDNLNKLPTPFPYVEYDPEYSDYEDNNIDLAFYNETDKFQEFTSIINPFHLQEQVGRMANHR